MLKSPPSLRTPNLTTGNNALKPAVFNPPAMRGKRIGAYGTGGIGKTTLAARSPGRKLFIDLDESLAELRDTLDFQALQINSASPLSWADLRKTIADANNVDTIIIDSVTRAEEMSVAHTLQNVKNEKENFVRSIEGYGYGKGYQHVFDTFLPLLADLDVHVRQGRNVILIMHECMSTVPNPQGEDYIRYEPRLQNPSSGKASIRLRLKEWLDHLVFIGYDINVKDNRAKSSGSRTIYPLEMAHCMAKSRSLREQIIYDEGSVELWDQLKLCAKSN